MKIVLGIDPSNPSEPITSLIGRLHFPDCRALCASIAPLAIMPTPGEGLSTEEIEGQIMRNEHDVIWDALNRAKAELEVYGIAADTIVEYGDPAHHLMRLADYSESSTIVIGSRNRGVVRSLVQGSIGRTLTIEAYQSVLIARQPLDKFGPLKAVFAYDGSEYCDRSVEILAQNPPAGLTQVDVLMVDPPNEADSPLRFLDLDDVSDVQARRAAILRQAERPAKILTEAGIDVRARCLRGAVAKCIRSAVADLDANLVILGAQGHGWLDRVLYGSVALQQAVGEHHSVLILRPAVETSRAEQDWASSQEML